MAHDVRRIYKQFEGRYYTRETQDEIISILNKINVDTRSMDHCWLYGRARVDGTPGAIVMELTMEESWGSLFSSAFSFLPFVKPYERTLMRCRIRTDQSPEAGRRATEIIALLAQYTPTGGTD
jgi:hypothetical protein